MNEVIADYLTVTVPSGSIPPHSLADYFVGIPSHTIREECPKTLYFTSDGGALIHTATKGFDRIAASGRILHHFRALGIFRDYLSLIADHPHNVTRLDLACDVPVNPADVLPVLYERYKAGYAFGRKAVPTAWTKKPGLDGRDSGCLYFGHRSKHKVCAAIYDKALEAHEERGEVLPECLRYEFRFAREVGASLRDAAHPEALFYHVASPDFLPRPPWVPEWAPGADPWRPGPRQERLPAEKAESLVDSCADLATLARYAAEIGPEGVPWVLKLIRKKLERGASSYEARNDHSSAVGLH